MSLLYARLLGAGAIVALCVGLWFYVQHLRTDAASLRSQLSDAEAAADLAQAQGNLTSDAAKVTDKASASTLDITVHQASAVQAVQAAQGASDAIPPDVLARLHDGLRSVRPQAATASRTGNPSGGQPAGTVSAP